MKRKILAQAFSEEGRPYSIPAPTGGWNASDPISKMKPTEAVYLDNFFPEASDVALRKGFTAKATLPADTTLLPHNIRTLIGYSPTTGTQKLFAACEDGIYDFTAGGAISAVASVTTNGVWQYNNVTTAGGSFLFMANGVDKCKLYDGAAWVNLDAASTPALTGVTSTDVINVSLHKKRLILTIKNSLSFYYLGTNAISGAATAFPLGALFKLGGYIMATDSWTIDNGEGSDDLFVAITSEGEVAVYKGNDPASDLTWALVGVYFIGRPLNRRCFAKMGGDLVVMTFGGLVPLSKALQSSSVDRTAGLTKKIHKAYTDYVSLYSDLYGWQMVLFPEGPFFLLNVPTLNYSTRNIIYSDQFVMNTSTGAWCRFTSMYAECWLAIGGHLYFARNNEIYEAWTGMDDNGGNISAKAKSAFSYLGSGRSKHIASVRPNVTSTVSVNLQLGIDMDFVDSNRFTATLNYAQTITLWDSAIWGESVFTSSSIGLSRWRTVPNVTGRAAAIRLRVNAKNVTMTWNSTDLILKDGGLM